MLANARSVLVLVSAIHRRKRQIPETFIQGGRPSTKRLTSAVIIITYRRPAILRDALLSWSASRRQPDQFIVVDASPDAGTRRDEIVTHFPGLFSDGPADYVVAREPSTTSQRNLGLNRVRADVAAFADDECRPTPEYLDRIMEVFELDVEQLIGGVGGCEPYEKTVIGRLRKVYGDVGRQVARSFGTTHAQAFPSGVRLPASTSRLPIRRVRDLQGLKMSFRTPLIRAERFDERMRRYALCEDLDVSMRVGRRHALVQRTDAIIIHENAPVARIGANARFLIGWINPAYLTEKLFPFDSNRRPLDRMLFLSRRGAVARALIRRDGSHYRVRERYDVAAAMIEYLRQAESSDVGDRFSALQEWIFSAASDADVARFPRYESWIAARESRTKVTSREPTVR